MSSTVPNRVEYLQPGTKNCSLRISDLRKSDSGAYPPHSKMPEQKGIQLLVADSSSAVTVSASPSSDITEGVALRLACGSPAASPQALFRWYKSTSSTPRHTGQVWDISEVTPGDSGSYYCQIQTGDIEQNSTMLPIDVECPTLSSANISAEEYGLHCCEARNRHGSQTDSVKLTDPKATDPSESSGKRLLIIGVTVGVILALVAIVAFLLSRRQKSSRHQSYVLTETSPPAP
ncbi:hypothetical protein F7725_018816 [Dissostichus mawsoni]|uniref:Ig-like domain-containing protein n=1 Tax=Dissostichus mawsoni TaxID=36200 RepID=A0A7J5XUD1_DISMA|nr:hypothetical protein F7725_018816 [Dissostichus mawsoni]